MFRVPEACVSSCPSSSNPVSPISTDRVLFGQKWKTNFFWQRMGLILEACPNGACSSTSLRICFPTGEVMMMSSLQGCPLTLKYGQARFKRIALPNFYLVRRDVREFRVVMMIALLPTEPPIPFTLPIMIIEQLLCCILFQLCNHLILNFFHVIKL